MSALDDIRARLRAAGVKTARHILCSDPVFIVEHAGVTAEEFAHVCAVEADRLGAPMLRGDLLYKRALEKVVVFSTAVDGLDGMLRGGIYTGEVVEVVGPSASGKSQLSMHMAAAAVAPGTHSVIYVDSSASFSAERVYSTLASPHFALTPEGISTAMQRIRVLDASDLPSLLTVLSDVEKFISTDRGSTPVRMVIVDSIGAAAAPSLGAGTARVMANAALSQVARLLSIIAVDHDIAILTTNYTTGGPQGSRAALGSAWSLASTTQLLLKRGNRSNERIVEVVRSSRLPFGIATNVFITDDGFK